MTEAGTPVVGVGASAGGVDAFHRFFKNMPADSGLAFVVVLHLSGGRKSLLPDILGRWTKMRVSEAQDGDPVTPNEVLVIPGGTAAHFQDGRLSLRPATNGRFQSVLSPIDGFFDSLAVGLGDDAIGVVLSGTGHDGALGLKAIKTAGGLTLAQGRDGSRPEYSGMPESAVAAGAVDLYVSVEDMPDHILGFRHARDARQQNGAEAARHAGEARLEICAILRARLGHDFSHYKHQTFMRRVQRRMQVLRLKNLPDYVRALKTEEGEAVLLFRDLLISVTSFFRDPHIFSAIETKIIPGLFAGKDTGSTVRIWVPGCATGEEAYSLGMLLCEYMDTLSAPPKVQIFASDIDDIAIGTARVGRFPATMLAGLSDDRRRRFFIQDNAGFSVRQEIRELCTFSSHSLIRDPPFSRIDLISCRNLLIYLDNDLQDQIIPIFHYALVPGGILMLGSSETIARHEELFEPIERAHRIFRRREGASDVAGMYLRMAGETAPAMGVGVISRSDPKAVLTKAVAVANRRILDRFAASFVVVNAAGDIVHFSSNTGRFLEPAAGSPNANLFDMTRKVWGLELRAALRRCVETGQAVEQQRTIATGYDRTGATVRLLIEPLPGPDPERLYMVVFDEAGPRSGGEIPDQPAASGHEGPAVAHLERENRELREQMQSIAEEHATAVEELRSSNEELQSVNEELQSSNEELETTREEIQSVNEELNVVNVQLSSKVDELDRSNGDLRNLFEITKVATIFLDPFLIVRSFTPEVGSIYNLIPGDIGRPLTDIVSRLNYSGLAEDVKSALQTLQPIERRVARLDESVHYLLRILPYRAPNGAIDGSLITFVDVTTIVRAEQHQRTLVDELNHRVKNMLTVVISLASNTLRGSTSLQGFEEVFLGRIHALSFAYALLSREGWVPIPIGEIMMQELRPFLSRDRCPER